jgi:hypothetical protein
MSGNHYSHNQEKGIYHILKYYTSLVNIEVMFSQKKKKKVNENGFLHCSCIVLGNAYVP